jgi:hypothetical protein
MFNIVREIVVWKNMERTRKAYAMLTFLLENGYGKWYPKVVVACRSLRHSCPHLEAKEISTSNGRNEMWRLRDLAIQPTNAPNTMDSFIQAAVESGADIKAKARLLDSGEDVGQSIRRSNRKTRQPSRFVNAAIFGLQVGRLLRTDPIWNIMTPPKSLPGTNGIILEQDMTSSSFFTRPEIVSSQATFRQASVSIQDVGNEIDGERKSARMGAPVEQNGIPGVSIVFCILPDVNLRAFHVIGKDVTDDYKRLSRKDWLEAAEVETTTTGQISSIRASDTKDGMTEDISQATLLKGFGMRVPEILSKVEEYAYGCVGVLTDIGLKLMTAAQLKALYNEYGLKVSGTKADSKERRREHLLKSP